MTRLTIAAALLATLISSHTSAQEPEPAPTSEKPTTDKPAKKPADKADATKKQKPADDESRPPEWGASGPYVLDLTAIGGFGARLDDPPLYALDERFGLLLGVGLTLSLSRRIALGLTYEHLDLGTERSEIMDTGTVNISRELHNGWLDLKIYPVRGEVVGVYLDLAASFAVQEAELTASVWSPVDAGNNLSFFCGTSGDPGFGLRGMIGIDAVIPPGFKVLADAGVANVRLSDDTLSTCAPGAGTSTVLMVRGALGYAWDL